MGFSDSPKEESSGGVLIFSIKEALVVCQSMCGGQKSRLIYFTACKNCAGGGERNGIFQKNIDRTPSLFLTIAKNDRSLNIYIPSQTVRMGKNTLIKVN